MSIVVCADGIISSLINSQVAKVLSRLIASCTCAGCWKSWTQINQLEAGVGLYLLNEERASQHLPGLEALGVGSWLQPLTFWSLYSNIVEQLTMLYCWNDCKSGLKQPCDTRLCIFTAHENEANGCSPEPINQQRRQLSSKSFRQRKQTPNSFYHPLIFCSFTIPGNLIIVKDDER